MATDQRAATPTGGGAPRGNAEQTVTGAEGIVRALGAEGVRHAFGILGIHMLGLYDALYYHPEIGTVTARHEEGAAHMADGYARAGGAVGVCLLSAGPGAANAASALGESYAASAPVLAIAGQIDSRHLGQRRGLLHEPKDQTAMFQSIVDWTALVTRPADGPAAIRAACRRVRNGRPRPAVVEVATDALVGEGEIAPAPPAEQVRPAADPADVRRAVEILDRAARPIIWAGGGAQDAQRELVGLAERLGSPVVTSIAGKNAFPADHPLWLGLIARDPLVRNLLAQADAVLAIGTHFDATATAEWAVRLPAALVHLDVDAAEIGRNYPVAVGLVADARVGITQLLAELGAGAGRRVWADVEGINAAIAAGYRTGDAAPEYGFVQDVRAALPRDAITVWDMTIPAYWSRPHFPVYAPRTYLHPVWGGLGYAVPAAIGAKVAQPDRAVVAVAGDGGFLFTGQELLTAVQNDIPIVVLVVNDGGYGVLRFHQDRRFGGRRKEVDLQAPDFQRLAEAYGVVPMRADSSEVRPALAEALAVGKPVLLEVRARFQHYRPRL